MPQTIKLRKGYPVMQMHKVLCERANDAQSSPRFSMTIISRKLDSIKRGFVFVKKT